MAFVSGHDTVFKLLESLTRNSTSPQFGRPSSAIPQQSAIGLALAEMLQLNTSVRPGQTLYVEFESEAVVALDVMVTLLATEMNV